MSDGDIDQFIQEVLWSTFPDQEPHVLERRGSPREEDDASDAEGSYRVKEPNFLELRSDDGHDQAEDVDEDVISVVELELKSASLMLAWSTQVIAYHEDTSCWVAANEEAIYKHYTL
jgi:hypothetical protein